MATSEKLNPGMHLHANGLSGHVSSRSKSGPGAPKYPLTFYQFARKFSNEKACADYLTAARWGDGFACPKCHDRRGYPLRGKALIECGNGHQISLTSGTTMHRTRLPLSTWFLGAWFTTMLKPGVSALQFQSQAGLSRYETAFQLLHKMRSSFVSPDRAKLSGIVEVDEIYVGGKEQGAERRGRGADTKALVAVAVEIIYWQDEAGDWHSKAGRARMQQIPNATKATLQGFVKKNVHKGSHIITDAHKGYDWLSGSDFEHEKIVAKRTADPLPTLGRITTNFKRWWIGTHKGAIATWHLQAYLNEYCFRFNRRQDPWSAFNHALGLIMLSRDRPEYKTLYSGTWKHRNPPVAKPPKDADIKVHLDFPEMD